MDTATGTDGVRIARDRRGNSSGWIRGTGQVSNGSTGETVTYTEPAPSGDQHSFRLTNPTTGSPFTAHCGAACEYRGAAVPGAPQVDHLVLRSGTADIVGRDRNGTPAMISFDGTGRFTSAEGDLLTGVGPVTSPGIATGRVNIVTRDRAGLGGSIALQGEGSIRPVEGGGLICTGGACAGTHHMPTERGAGGVNVCSLTAAGSCTGIGAPVGSGRTTAADLQLASVPAGQGGSVYFVQYLRNADGTGGGAVSFVTGAGEAEGYDAYGNWVRADGAGARTALLYAESDGYHSGQACVAGTDGSCTGSAPAERRLRWVEPGDAMIRALGPGPGFIGPVAVTQRGQADAVFEFVEGQSHLRWMAETGNAQLRPVTTAYAAAKADDVVTPAEARELQALVEGLDPRTRTRSGGTEGALDTVLLVNGTLSRTTEDVERTLAGNPELVATLLGRSVGPGWQPSDGDLAVAKNRLLDQQAASAGIARELTALQPRRTALADRIADYEQDVRAYNAGGAGDAAELAQRRERIVADSRALDLLEQPIRARLADSQTVLRGYDLAAGLAGGDAGYAADMDLAARNLAAVDGVVDLLPQNLDPATVDAIIGFSDAVRLGYEASIEAPRAPANRLGDLQLPSTGAADLALAMRANLGYDYIATLVRSENSPFVNQDGSDFTPDQISDVAATWVYDRRPGSAAELARLDATPRQRPAGPRPAARPAERPRLRRPPGELPAPDQPQRADPGRRVDPVRG
jgi:hypothetical protein